MIDLNSFQTFSGLLGFFAILALLYRRLMSAAILFTIEGAGGVGIFWERWSRLAGHQARITTLISGVRPTDAQLWLLSTHLPVLLIGVGLLIVIGRGQSAGGSRDV